ncbi:hypothetical protein HOY80DRAFT_335409 [Tuber brumale]|nr:hypothetical protein HOY80DRAFT_335409 [Tuber brumale]
MSLSPDIGSDLRILPPITENTENTDDQTLAFTRSNRHLHPPLRLPDPHFQTSHRPAETENPFFLPRPPRLPFPTFDEIAPHIVPPTEPPAMPEVADDLDAESRDDDASAYREAQARFYRAHRTRHDSSTLARGRVLKVQRVRKHQSSSARRERKIRSRSHSSDMDRLDGAAETYSRQQRLGGYIPMQGEKLQEEPGSFRHGKASDLLANVPGMRVECTGESRPVTPPKIDADTGWMDWCQQTPPHQTCLEECSMDWSENSPPAPGAAPPPPPPPPPSIY